MWFSQNPEIIFYYFLHILNLDIFLVLILQKSIGSRYLVPLTPPFFNLDIFLVLILQKRIGNRYFVETLQVL